MYHIQEKERRKKLDAFYNSKEWKKTREYCLMRDKYLCRICRVKPAEVVHHIKHLTEDNVDDLTVSLNPDNLISLCSACHFEEHRGEHAGGRAAHESENMPQYTFDENGHIIPKPTMHGEQT